MGLVEFVSRPLNYATTAADRTIKKIAGNPSAVKKTLQLASKLFVAFDLYYIGTVQTRAITDVMKGTTELIEFYGTYKDLISWVHLFSKESLDTDLLKQSIQDSLCASLQDPTAIKKQEKIAKKIFEEVMAVEEYHSKGEVLEAIKVSLKKHGYQTQINTLAERIIVKQKASSITQSLCMVCFTIADLGSNILVLKKWQILDLSQLAVTVGSQSRVFVFMSNLGAETVLGSFASAGLVLVVGEASCRAIMHGNEFYYAVDDKKKKAYQELRNALIDLVAGGVDLIALSACLMFVLNPPVIVGLAIFSKGTGLICMLVR